MGKQMTVKRAIQRVQREGCLVEIHKGMNNSFIHLKQTGQCGLSFWRAVDFLKTAAGCKVIRVKADN